MLIDMINCLREDLKHEAAGKLTHDDADNNPSLTPTNDSFPPGASESDDQTTPTGDVFPSNMLNPVPGPFPDCSSSIVTAPSSVMTTDSTTPLIPPVIPPPVVEANRRRGPRGLFRLPRRNANDSFPMKKV